MPDCLAGRALRSVHPIPTRRVASPEWKPEPVAAAAHWRAYKGTVAQACHLHLLQGMLDTGGHCLPRYPQVFQAKRHFFKHGVTHARKLVGRVLQHQPYSPGELAGIVLAGVHTADGDRTLHLPMKKRWDQACQCQAQAGFSRSIGADHGDQLPGLDLEGDILQGRRSGARIGISQPAWTSITAICPPPQPGCQQQTSQQEHGPTRQALG